jgi:DNA ligase D-like protein (predicted 3'-phosphoesterase)
MAKRDLNEYQAKRDFAKTSEPSGGGATPEGSLFVVQEHYARRHHFDLRLQLDGVLVSWAVPKDVPTQPGIRRLAVHVEDHPLEYADFEGEIPKGEYGAGTVTIFDRGTWSSDEDPRKQLTDGKLEFVLEGTKLRGRYMLIRTKPSPEDDKDEWLLMRKADKRTRAAAADFDLTAELERAGAPMAKTVSSGRPAAKGGFTRSSGTATGRWFRSGPKAMRPYGLGVATSWTCQNCAGPSAVRLCRTACWTENWWRSTRGV